MKIGVVTISERQWWIFMWRAGHYYGIFRNKPGTMPGRWGFYILGFEFGSRNPQNPTGVWLKQKGLWPW